jgi:hypothetical protein
MTELDEFRAAKDDFFAHDRQSPLTRPQRQAFTGLHYFPENPALRLEVEVKPFPRQVQRRWAAGRADPLRYRGWLLPALRRQPGPPGDLRRGALPGTRAAGRRQIPG